MTKIWYNASCTRLKSETLGDVNVGHHEKDAKQIYEKCFGANNDNPSLYGGTDRVTKEWLKTVLKRGTGSDRILALAFMIRENPISSLPHIEALLAFISPVKKQLCIKAIDVLSSLFENNLLPHRRALIPFENRPFNILSKYPTALTNELECKGDEPRVKLPRNSRESILALWYFENMLKQCYSRFLTSLENILMADTIPAEKHKALNALVNLVTTKPENRETAIGIMVNKLGDRSRGFASSVIHKLRTMCDSHPHLKGALMEQIRVFLFRPNLLDRAKYYAIALLSCIPLSKRPQVLSPPEDTGTGDTSIAAALFRVYLSFFRASVASKDLPERFIANLLTGISRIAPYLSEQVMSENVQDIDAIFRLVHVTMNFRISLQALSFLFHFTSHQHQLRDRYYQALYRKLTDSSIRWSAHGPSILNLLYQSLLADNDPDRQAAFIQRLCSICLDHPNPGFVAGSQILIEKLFSAKKINPIGAAPGQSKELRPDTKDFPTLIGTVRQRKLSNTGDSDSDEEHFSDVTSSDEENEKGSDEKNGKNNSSAHSGVGWEHKSLVNKNNHSRATTIGYNNSARDPRFARALGHPCWQLVLLADHSHPTVAYFAKCLITGSTFKYTGDPFEDFSVAHFMERFVYKKPKPTSEKSTPKTGKLRANAATRKPVHAKTLAPDSLAYKNLNPDQIPSEERFIHSYFNFINTRSNKRDDGQDSDDSDLDRDFDAYLRKHEKGLIPNDMDGNDDDDIDDADFNYTSDEEEDESEKESKSKKKVKKESKMQDVDLENGEEGDVDGFDSWESGDEEDTDDEDDFAPSRRGQKSDKFDLNKLFVSAEEVGDLYDNQAEDGGSKGSKWQKMKGKKHSVFKRTKRQQAFVGLKKRRLQHKGSTPREAKKSRRS